MNIVKNFIVAVTVLLSANMAHALDLATAKAQGLVGEQPDGYIGVIKQNDEVISLVEEINAKRKEAYKNISAENGQPMNVVETLAAKKLYEKLQASEYYQSAEGKWLQKWLFRNVPVIVRKYYRKTMGGLEIKIHKT